MSRKPDEAGKEKKEKKEANGAVAREEAIHKDDHAKGKGGGSKEGRSEDEML
jgi:hypothetical protein